MRQWATRGADIVFGRQVSGGEALLQRQDHMLRTAPGDLLANAEWGIGLDGLLGKNNVDATSLAAIASAQHKTDPETASADVSIQASSGTLKYAATFTTNNGQSVELATVIE